MGIFCCGFRWETSISLPHRHDGAAPCVAAGLEKQPLEGQLQATSVLPGTMSSFCLDLQDQWVWEDAMTASSCNGCCQVEEDEEEATTEQALHCFSIFLVDETTQLISWCSKYSNVLPREEGFGCS